jgi:hypothetical protein
MIVNMVVVRVMVVTQHLIGLVNDFLGVMLIQITLVDLLDDIFLVIQSQYIHLIIIIIIVLDLVMIVLLLLFLGLMLKDMRV